jgi:hypothetical protein
MLVQNGLSLKLLIDARDQQDLAVGLADGAPLISVSLVIDDGRASFDQRVEEQANRRRGD